MFANLTECDKFEILCALPIAYEHCFKILNAASKGEIFSVSQIPWASGSSWAEGIEKGLSNLGSFLYRNRGVSKSRSGTGIQVLNDLRSTNFKTQPYISKIIDRFYKNVTTF